MEKLVAAVGVVAVALGSIIGITILSGFVMTAMWTWFVVPVFHVAPLTIPQAIGLGLIVGYWTKQDIEKKEGDNATVYLLGVGLGKPLMYLLIGYIVSRWM